MSIAFAALLLLAPQDEIFSGPQQGEKTATFKSFDLDSKEDVDYVASFNGAPTVLVFMHELTRPAVALMRPLDQYAQMKSVRGLKIAYVALVDDRDQAERHLPVVRGAINLKSPLGISLDGKEGPGAYGLNRKVTLTVLVAKGNKVHANFAILSPNETDFPKVKKAIDEVLASTATAEVPSGTTEELAKEVARLREENLQLREKLIAAEMRAERSESQMARMQKGRGGRTMRRQPQPKKEDPNAKPPQRGRGEGGDPSARDERLVGMMRGLIQKTATPEDIASTVKRIDAYIAENPRTRAQYVDILGRIIEAGYGTEHAQTVIKQQREKHSK